MIERSRGKIQNEKRRIARVNEEGILSRGPGEKGTSDLQKHPVAPRTKGERTDGKGNTEVARSDRGRGAGERRGMKEPFESRER